jgi:O-acetyl-ADP-ribose deacetylase (regulator of RNase III)
MINYVTGNLLEAEAEALVNTVNTVGVMGKGIALQFRQAYPENYEAYRKACKHKEVQPGHMFVYRTGKLTNPRFIINFPTKRHWKGKARLEDIEVGLHDLIEVIKQERISSIAVPPLGCGNGGLNWDVVRERIVTAFEVIPDVSVLLYAPEGAPKAETMRVATKRPKMTAGRAAILGLLRNYALPGYRLTMLEIQKLAYFLQVAGEPLKLNFVKGRYGPYTETLHHVLQRIEGHFIRGYGDRSRDASVEVYSDAINEAKDFLQEHLETLKRLEQVSRLIEGFETPYGMELLATVHWVAQEEPTVKENVSVAVSKVQEWSDHKLKTFRPEHIKVAWSRLSEEHWI